MKKFLLIFILIVFCILFYSNSTIANSYQVTVTINEKLVKFDDYSGYPFVDKNNRTQVPFRKVLEEFGAKVDWNYSTKTALAGKGFTHVEIPIGESYIFKDGTRIENDTSSLIVNDRTYLPIRVVLEAFGAEVTWNSETNTVAVIEPSFEDSLLLTENIKLDDGDTEIERKYSVSEMKDIDNDGKEEIILKKTFDRHVRKPTLYKYLKWDGIKYNVLKYDLKYSEQVNSKILALDDPETPVFAYISDKSYKIPTRIYENVSIDDITRELVTNFETIGDEGEVPYIIATNIYEDNKTAVVSVEYVNYPKVYFILSKVDNEFTIKEITVVRPVYTNINLNFEVKMRAWFLMRDLTSIDGEIAEEDEYRKEQLFYENLESYIKEVIKYNKILGDNYLHFILYQQWLEDDNHLIDQLNDIKKSNTFNYDENKLFEGIINELYTLTADNVEKFKEIFKTTNGKLQNVIEEDIDCDDVKETILMYSDDDDTNIRYIHILKKENAKYIYSGFIDSYDLSELTGKSGKVDEEIKIMKLTEENENYLYLKFITTEGLDYQTYLIKWDADYNRYNFVRVYK